MSITPPIAVLNLKLLLCLSVLPLAKPVFLRLGCGSGARDSGEPAGSARHGGL